MNGIAETVKSLSNVTEVSFGNLLNIPAQLRAIADEVEGGGLGEVSSGVLILQGDTIERYGIGTNTVAEIYMMLGIAQRLFEKDMLDE